MLRYTYIRLLNVIIIVIFFAMRSSLRTWGDTLFPWSQYAGVRIRCQRFPSGHRSSFRRLAYRATIIFSPRCVGLVEKSTRMRPRPGAAVYHTCQRVTPPPRAGSVPVMVRAALSRTRSAPLCLGSYHISRSSGIVTRPCLDAAVRGVRPRLISYMLRPMMTRFMVFNRSFFHRFLCAYRKIHWSSGRFAILQLVIL